MPPAWTPSPTWGRLPLILLIISIVGPDVRLYARCSSTRASADYDAHRAQQGSASRRPRCCCATCCPTRGSIITNNVTNLFPFLILGSFPDGRYFSIPGVGSSTIDALNRGDLPILKADDGVVGRDCTP